MIPPPGVGAAPVRRQAPPPLDQPKGVGQQLRRELARNVNQPLQTGCCPAPGGGMIPPQKFRFATFLKHLAEWQVGTIRSRSS